MKNEDALHTDKMFCYQCHWRWDLLFNTKKCSLGMSVAPFSWNVRLYYGVLSLHVSQQQTQCRCTERSYCCHCSLASIFIKLKGPVLHYIKVPKFGIECRPQVRIFFVRLIFGDWHHGPLDINIIKEGNAKGTVSLWIQTVWHLTGR